jgi:hypothetical protein
MRVGLHLSGHAARALLVALLLFAPVLVLTIAADEVRAGADWIAVAPLRFLFAALLRALPWIAFPALLLAAAWTRAGLDRRGEALLFGSLGFSRWRVATWAALPSLLVAASILHLSREAIPRASAALRQPTGLALAEVARWVELRRSHTGQSSVLLGAGSSEGTLLRDLRLARAEPRTVLQAEEAELRAVVGDPQHIVFELRRGSLHLPELSGTPLGPEAIRFQGGSMRLNPAAFAAEDASDHLRVAETPSARLARNAALLARVPGMARHAAKLLHERLHRPLSSILPFLLVWLVHWRWAGRPYPALGSAELWLVPALMLVASLLPLSLARLAAESSHALANGLLALSVVLPVALIRAIPARAEVAP